ncbi:uncharacterized protein MCYG_07139 [Microsporum canis CBS 113480]|uniref:Uncharacterized protein n=1 Tax=Arthroderma otae (strain ATCC MYA-4605 / CBS 113480) TaxID=554155 RepID=C5FWN6_ARTOC|nr:uncharacterized protein MCYG_07139 [Microsporum canis CBS 113480]EEQ34320.1 predicted protein [Microsporum canis CBS 113480]
MEFVHKKGQKVKNWPVGCSHMPPSSAQGLPHQPVLVVFFVVRYTKDTKAPAGTTRDDTKEENIICIPCITRQIFGALYLGVSYRENSKFKSLGPLRELWIISLFYVTSHKYDYTSTDSGIFGDEDEMLPSDLLE